MPKLSKILWTLIILCFVVTVITFAFGLVIVGAVIFSLIGVYRYYLARKRSRSFTPWQRGFSSGEIVDIRSETIHQVIRDVK